MSKTVSKLSLAYQLKEESLLYTAQPTQILAPSQGVSEFSMAKVVLRNNEIHWSCPGSLARGTMSLGEISRQIEKGKGLIAGNELEMELEKFGRFPAVDTETMLLLTDKADSMLFIAFDNAELFSSWTHGKVYTDLIELLNSFDLNNIESDCEDSSQDLTNAIIFDLRQSVHEEMLVVRGTFLDLAKKAFVVTFSYKLEQLKEIWTGNALGGSALRMGVPGRQILRAFLLDCARLEVIQQMSGDIFSLTRKKIKIRHSPYDEQALLVKKWAQNIEVAYKFQQLTTKLGELKDELEDPVLQCLELLEIQKIMYQIELHGILNQESPNEEMSDSEFLASRIEESVRKREAINSGRSQIRGKSRFECGSCNFGDISCNVF